MKIKLALLVLALSALAAPQADAQSSSPRPVNAQGDDTDSRWLPWLGCWQLIAEGVREGDEEPESIRGRVVPGDMRVCVAPVPGPPSGVRMSTFSGSQTLLEETIVADGTERKVDEANCRGGKRAEWSQDGQRLFTRAELACQTQPVRQLSGITLMAPGGMWVDIQYVDSPGNESVRVRRYRRISDQDATASFAPELLNRAASAAQLAGGAPFEVEDVIEASGKVSPRALEAALVERRATFALDRRMLIALDEAGVEDAVIDLMVALSYPERFVVDRAGGSSYGAFGASMIDFDPFWYGTYFPYYYYSPFGYAYWGRYGFYDPYYFYQPGGPVIIVPPGGEPGPPRGEGRVVKGQGYTRVRPRDTSDGSVAAPRSGRASTSGSSSGSSSSSSGSSESSGGSISPQGASSGGSGSDSGRSAVPR